MKTFTDNAGRTWTVALNVATLKRVKSLAGVDMLGVVNDGGQLLERLAGDPVFLCDVIFAVCKGEADAKGVTDADFGGAMAGDPIETATTALLEELVDFFPRGKRDVLRRALQKMRLYEEKFLKAAQLKLDDPRMDEAVEFPDVRGLRGIFALRGDVQGLAKDLGLRAYGSFRKTRIVAPRETNQLPLDCHSGRKPVSRLPFC